MHIQFDVWNALVHIISMSAAFQRDYQRLSRELVRALRGRRSQLALSRRLGYTTNAVYTWEAGSAWPTAARFFELTARVGVRQSVLLSRFFRTAAPGLAGVSISTPAGVQRLLQEILGHTRISALAKQSKLSRFSLSRWLHGKGQPRLPDLLCFIEHSSLRLLDFVDAVVTPTALPSMVGEWKKLQDARAVGYDHPFSHAVLRALETTAYKRQRHDADSLTAMLGISRAAVELCLEKLAASGQIRRHRGRWEPRSAAMVDFRREPEAAQRLKAFWASVGSQRAAERRPGLFAYNVFAVSRKDLARLEALQRDCLREMRTIIAASEPSEVVALANLQVFCLGE